MNLRLQPSTLSVFGKGAPGSVGLSFAPSASAHCSRRCPHYGTRCYAERLEARYSKLAAKLERHHAQGFERTCRDALAELEAGKGSGFVPIWFRFSVCGSFPAQPTPEDVRALRALVEWLNAHRVPIHLPIETRAKATRYRRALRGLGVTVRESATSERRARTAPGPVSWVTVGGGVPDAKKAARARTRATGRKCIVCPAVAAKKLNGDVERAKCGNCTACADPAVDVIYPSH